MPDSGRRFIPVAAVAVACSGLLATAALAAPIAGTAGDDRIRGTVENDTIQAREGDDRVFAKRGRDSVDLGPGADRAFGMRGADDIFGGAGPDRIWGGRGDDTLRGDADGIGDLVSRDRLHGGRGNDRSSGGDGDDYLSGGRGNDVQDGGSGNDVIFANKGRDHTEGGPGDDRLWALSFKDVHGPADTQGDLVRGGEGNDRIAVRDGEVDVVNCGPGIDKAILDFRDVLEDPASCEVVTRHRPRRTDSRLEDRNDE